MKRGEALVAHRILEQVCDTAERLTFWCSLGTDACVFLSEQISVS